MLERWVVKVVVQVQVAVVDEVAVVCIVVVASHGYEQMPPPSLVL